MMQSLFSFVKPTEQQQFSISSRTSQP